MPLFFADLVPGSGTYLYQETLYRSESGKRRLRRTAPCGPPGMATQARPAYRRRYLCSSIVAVTTKTRNGIGIRIAYWRNAKMTLNLNSLVVKRQNDNPSPGAETEGNKSLSLTRDVNLDTQSSNNSAE